MSQIQIMILGITLFIWSSDLAKLTDVGEKHVLPENSLVAAQLWLQRGMKFLQQSFTFIEIQDLACRIALLQRQKLKGRDVRK